MPPYPGLTNNEILASVALKKEMRIPECYAGVEDEHDKVRVRFSVSIRVTDRLRVTIRVRRVGSRIRVSVRVSVEKRNANP